MLILVTMEIHRQNMQIKKMYIPVHVLVHTGKKKFFFQIRFLLKMT